MSFKFPPSKFLQLYFCISSIGYFSLLAPFRGRRFILLLVIACLSFCVYGLLYKKKAVTTADFSDQEKVFGLILSGVAFLDYYYQLIPILQIRPRLTMRMYALVSERLSLSQDEFYSALKAVTILIGIAACLAGIFSACVLASALYPKIKNILSLSGQLTKTYKTISLVLSGIYIVSFSSIFRSDFYYIDDLRRAVDGHSLRGDFSRYVSELLSKILHTNSYLADISPLPQITALLIMAFTGIVLLHVVSDFMESPPNFWHVIYLIPIGLSPYFLVCLSYRYDAPYMALSVLSSVFPFLYYKKSFKSYGIAVFACMLIMCMTYQVSSGILPMITIFLCFLMWMKKYDLKQIASFALVSAVGYIAALLVFRLFIMAPVRSDNYVGVGVTLGRIPYNVREYLRLFNQDFPTIWKMLMVLIALSFAVYSMKASRQNKAVTFCAVVFLVPILFLLSFGVYIAFSDPLFEPRAFYGIGIFISLISLPIFSKRGWYPPKAAIVALSWIFFVFSFIYGNALSLQKEYVNFRTEQVIDDLNRMELLSTTTPIKYRIVGSTGFHRAVKKRTTYYPLLKRMVPIHFQHSEWYWGRCQFQEHYGLDAEVENDSELQLDGDHLLKETYYYSLYEDQGVITILLNDTEQMKEDKISEAKE